MFNAGDVVLGFLGDIYSGPLGDGVDHAFLGFLMRFCAIFVYSVILIAFYFLLRILIALFGGVIYSLRKHRKERQPQQQPPRLKLVPTAKDKRRPRRRWMPSHLATLPIPATSPSHDISALPIPASPQPPDVDQLPRPI